MSTKFSALLCEFDDIKRETVETGIQTDPVQFHRESIWNTESSSQRDESNHTGNLMASETYIGESIPPVSAEQTLMALDIVSVIRNHIPP